MHEHHSHYEVQRLENSQAMQSMTEIQESRSLSLMQCYENSQTASPKSFQDSVRFRRMLKNQFYLRNRVKELEGQITAEREARNREVVANCKSIDGAGPDDQAKQEAKLCLQGARLHNDLVCAHRKMLAEMQEMHDKGRKDLTTMLSTSTIGRWRCACGHNPANQAA